MKLRALATWDWILRISGTLSLINLMNDLSSWQQIARKLYSLVADLIPELATLIASAAYHILLVSGYFVDFAFAFIPAPFRSQVAVTIVSAFLVLRVIMAEHIRTSSQNSALLLVFMFVIGVDAVARSVFYPSALVYGSSVTLIYFIALHRSEGLRFLQYLKKPPIWLTLSVLILSYVFSATRQPTPSNSIPTLVGNVMIVSYPIIDFGTRLVHASLPRMRKLYAAYLSPRIASLRDNHPSD